MPLILEQELAKNNSLFVLSLDFVPPSHEQSQPYRSFHLSSHSLNLFPLLLILQLGSYQPPFSFAYTVQKNPITVFPILKLDCLFVPNSYINVTVSDLYIPRIQADLSWKYIQYINCSRIHQCGNWETEHYNSVLEIMRPRSFINGNT